MGSPEMEQQRGSNEIQHRVVLTQGFWLADTACTQALWQAVMGKNPSYFKGEEKPVEQVSWDDCQQFIERFNEIIPEGGFRLPTEAEWEYACRAGTTTPFSFGDQITPELVNYHGNYPYADGKKGLDRGETIPVKELQCNDWGLYQMHGNIWEWCQNWYSDYDTTVVEDPTGVAAGDIRVLRGGCWAFYGRHVRSAERFANAPDERVRDIGFRLARGQTAELETSQAQRPSGNRR